MTRAAFLFTKEEPFQGSPDLRLRVNQAFLKEEKRDFFSFLSWKIIGVGNYPAGFAL